MLYFLSFLTALGGENGESLPFGKVGGKGKRKENCRKNLTCVSKTFYMKIKNLLLLTILSSIYSFSWSQATVTMMKVVGTKQGSFKGESLMPRYSDKAEVLGYSMEIKSPRDAASGQATGRRQHMPLTIWKATGASSPQFFSAITTNEALKTVTIEFYKPDEVFKSSGTEQLYFKIELVNASIASFKQVMGAADLGSFRSNPALMYDEIKFVYEKITVTHGTGGVSASDNLGSIN